MRSLIVEDDLVSQEILKRYLAQFGECTAVMDGEGAVRAVEDAFAANQPYDLICMDIVMPGMDGQKALSRIRQLETDKGLPPSGQAKIIMTTVLSEPISVVRAFRARCDSYIIKPLSKDKLQQELFRLGLIDQPIAADKKEEEEPES